MSSIFSKIINREIPSYIVAENEKFLAFLDIYPLTKGHTLVIPKLEIDYYFDIQDELFNEMNIFSKKVSFKKVFLINVYLTKGFENTLKMCF